MVSLQYKYTYSFDQSSRLSGIVWIYFPYHFSNLTWTLLTSSKDAKGLILKDWFYILMNLFSCIYLEMAVQLHLLNSFVCNKCPYHSSFQSYWLQIRFWFQRHLGSWYLLLGGHFSFYLVCNYCTSKFNIKLAFP